MSEKGIFSIYGQRTKRAYYEAMHASLRTERATFDAHYQDLGKFLQPRRVRFQSNDKNKGEGQENLTVVKAR
jgi:hypothetical protein